MFLKLKSSCGVMFRQFSTNIKPQVCIVGSGPAGFYTAQHLSSRLQNAQIDIFERAPIPFGLVRFGVAPDHANLKKCTNQFSKVAEFPHVKFYGNIEIGKDVSFRELKEAYHVVVLAYGADDSVQIGVKGQDLSNIFQAKDFVGWYNGVPGNNNLKVDLSGETATIIGHGNVAIDVARILLSSIDKLKTTDITQHALETLSHSRIKEVHLVGRRSPLHVAFTTKELRELLNLEACCPIWNPRDFTEEILTIAPTMKSPRKRLSALIVENFQSSRKPQVSEKILRMICHRSPKEFHGENLSKIERVTLTVNTLAGKEFLTKRAVPTEETESVKTNLIVNSVGYKSVQVDKEIPFNVKKGIVDNVEGKVGDNVYATGWVATGPTGVLLSTMQNAFAVSGSILKDVDSGGVLTERKGGFEEVQIKLNQRNTQVVHWEHWLKIDEFERKQGEKVNKPREKLVDTKEMLKIAFS